MQKKMQQIRDRVKWFNILINGVPREKRAGKKYLKSHCYCWGGGGDQPTEAVFSITEIHKLNITYNCFSSGKAKLRSRNRDTMAHKA